MTVIVGLEGVLARHEWRLPLRESEGWDAYYAAATKDAPNNPMVQLVNALHHRGQAVFCVTPTPERWHNAIAKWMVRHGVPVEEIFGRIEGDWRPEQEVREDILRGLIGHTAGEVLMAIDENEKACDIYRAAGIPVLQVFNPNGGT